MISINSPFRYDYVGSFLRPESIKQARAEFKAGAITAAQLRKTEDQAIRDGFAHLEPSTRYDALYEAALCRERAD